jgi:hypothetical protein
MKFGGNPGFRKADLETAIIGNRNLASLTLLSSCLFFGAVAHLILHVNFLVEDSESCFRMDDTLKTGGSRQWLTIKSFVFLASLS